MAASSAGEKPDATRQASTPLRERLSGRGSWHCCRTWATELVGCRLSAISFDFCPKADSRKLTAMPLPFHTFRLVEFADTDMAGIMHFSAFFRFMEAAEHALLRSLGLSVYSEINGEVVTFPRVAASCEY